MTKEQSEAIAEVADFAKNELATKADLLELKKDLLELKKDIKSDMKILGAMIIFGVALLGLLIQIHH